jgi:hypothetical protein
MVKYGENPLKKVPPKINIKIEDIKKATMET